MLVHLRPSISLSLVVILGAMALSGSRALAQAAGGARLRTNRSYTAPSWASGAVSERSTTDDASEDPAPYFSASSDSADRFERATINRLNQTITMHATATPLSEVIAEIATQTGTPIVLDVKALTEASIQPGTEITSTRSIGSAKALLGSILENMDCNWVIADGAIVVTTESRAKELVTVRVYPVYDLVAAKDTAGNVAYDFDQLIEVIASTVAPTTWSEAGGSGSLSPFTPSCGLVVAQTREVHDRIAGLLAGLRRTRRFQGLPTLPTVPDVEREAPFEQVADDGWQSSIEVPQDTVRRGFSGAAVPAWRLPHSSDASR